MSTSVFPRRAGVKPTTCPCGRGGPLKKGLCKACYVRELRRRHAEGDHVRGWQRREKAPPREKKVTKVEVGLALLTDADHEAFVGLVLWPVIRRARRLFHRHPQKEDLVQEAVALAWKKYVQDRGRGLDPAANPAGIVWEATAKARGGVRVAGSVGRAVPTQPLVTHDKYGEEIDDFGVEHDPTWVLDSGGMDTRDLIDLL
jgi:hypothetical protein